MQEETSFANLRRTLKNKIYFDRATEWTSNGYEPVCAVCGAPFRNTAPDMHETFISRGDVMKNKELQFQIMVPYNCVLIHRTCHQGADSENGKKACARHILQHENETLVLAWLHDMQIRMRTSLPQEAIRLIREVQNEL